MPSVSTTLRSGELARQCDISTDTLRHYERIGVLPRPRRTASGYRQYAPEAVRRVQLIRRALEIGFTLEELARILSVRDSGGAPCREVRALAETKLDHVIQSIAGLTALRDHMRRVLADWDRRLASAPRGARAGLLEALLDFPGSVSKQGALKSSVSKTPRADSPASNRDRRERPPAIPHRIPDRKGPLQ